MAKDQKQFSMLSWAIMMLGVVMSLYHISYVAGFLEAMGVNIGPVPHRALSLAFAMVLTFLLFPHNKKTTRTSLPWYDMVLIVLSLVGCLYVFVGYERWVVFRPGITTTVEIVLAITTILLLFEAGRRSMGIALSLVAICFLLYALFNNYLPGFLQGRGYPLSRLAGQIYLSSEGIWGLPMGVAATVIISFVIFGQFISISGAGDFFLNIAFSLLGRTRGGTAKAALVSSALFGSINGSTAANVVTTGVITIPLMKSEGYSPEFAGAVESVSSNGGQLLPPVMGAVAFVMVELLEISYVSLCAAALIPALLYYIAEFIVVDFEAGRRGLKATVGREKPSLGRLLIEGWPHLIPILVLLIFLVGLFYRPEASVLYALLALVVTGQFRRSNRIGVKNIIRGLGEGAQQMVVVSVACALAGIIMGCLSLTGVALRLTSGFMALSGGNLLVLLVLVALASFILGMGMSSVPCYLMTVLVASPALVQLGVPVFNAHMFCFYWATASFITPPVALACYTASSIARADPIKIGFEAMRLGMLLYILPFLFIYRPGLLLVGMPLEIILTTVAILVALFDFVAAAMGYFLTRLSWWERIIFLIAGIACAVPPFFFNLIGACLTAVLVYKHVRANRRRTPGLEGARTDVV